MTIREFHDADGVEIQPYYAAFMIEHDLDRRLVGSQILFMSWISAMWRIFETYVCRCDPTPHIRRMHSREFTAWLQLRVMA